MNNNNNHGNKFFEGFVWGLIIGGAIVFILGTEKGKKLFKALTEGGMGSLADILEEVDLNEYDEDYEEIEEVEEEKASNGNGIEKSEKVVSEKKPSIRKRFFRKRSS